jgi:hypothetical protein
MSTFYNQNIHSEFLLETNSWRTQRDSWTDATHVMDPSHAFFNVFDGTNEAVYLTDATGLNVGHEYFFANDTTNTVNTYTYDGTFLTSLGANSRSFFFLNDNTTSAGDWIYLASSAATAASYSIYGFYGGNANVGRILEIYPGEASDDAPYIVVSPLAIVAMTLGATTPNTGTSTVGVFKTTDTVNPVATISLVNSQSAILTDLFYPFDAGDQIFFRVTAGTILKPYITLYFAGL